MKSSINTIHAVCFIAFAVSSVGLPPQAVYGATIEEVVVTARKREESLQDVPISVQAFGGEQIAQQSIIDIQALVPYIPGFSYTPSPGASDLYFMRGLGTYGSGVHFEPGVGQVFKEPLINSC